MNKQEVINVLEKYTYTNIGLSKTVIKAHVEAIAAIKELEGFKELGLTAEQLREVDKMYTEKCEELAKCKKRLEKFEQLGIAKNATTKADRIRSMSDEELAEFIIKNCDNPVSEKNEDMCDFCDLADNENGCCFEESCKKAIVRWLRTKVTEE